MSNPSFVKVVQPLLNQEAELELFDAWKDARDNGDTREENRLFKQITIQFSPIVSKAVNKMKGYGLDRDDVLGEALLALSRAAIDFKPELGYRFGTYASTCVLSTLYTYVTKNYFITNVCANSKNKKVFFRLRRIMAEQTRNDGQPVEMTYDHAIDLAKTLEVDVDTVITMSNIMRDPYNSLNQPVGDDSDGAMLTHQDLLVSLVTPQDKELENKQLAALHSKLIDDALQTLDHRTRDIVADQLLRPEGERVTLEELGDRFSISKERARQVRETGKKKVKKHISEQLQNLDLNAMELFLD